MGDLIELKSSEPAVFRELLDDTIDRLQAAANVLIEDAVNLGMHGPWKEWNEQQPVGAVLTFSYDALADCGDPRLAKLYGLYCEMCELIEELRPSGGKNT